MIVYLHKKHTNREIKWTAAANNKILLNSRELVFEDKHHHCIPMMFDKTRHRIPNYDYALGNYTFWNFMHPGIEMHPNPQAHARVEDSDHPSFSWMARQARRQYQADGE